MVDYKTLDFAINNYGINHPITISISQSLDKVIVEKQLEIKEVYDKKSKKYIL